MKAPDKIFVPVVYLGPEEGDCPSPIWWEKDKSHEHEEVIGSIIYIRKDLVDEKLKTAEETIQLAEDHAYLAGAVNEREKMMKEAVECYYGYVNNCTKVFLPEETLKGIKEGYVKIVILKNDGYPSDKKD